MSEGESSTMTDHTRTATSKSIRDKLRAAAEAAIEHATDDTQREALAAYYCELGIVRPLPKPKP